MFEEKIIPFCLNEVRVKQSNLVLIFNLCFISAIFKFQYVYHFVLYIKNVNMALLTLNKIGSITK